MTISVVLQYVGGLLIAVVGYQEFMAKLSPQENHAPNVFYWVVAVGVFAIGTVMRLSSATPDRRRDVRAHPMRLSFPPVTEAEASTVITRVMANELRASRPWIKVFAWVNGVFAALLILSGSMQVIVSIFNSERAMILFGLATAIFVLLLGALYATLCSYVRQHANAVGAIRATLTESTFSAIVDSQRRIWRFFGVTLSFVIGVSLVLFLAGFVFGLTKLLR